MLFVCLYHGDLYSDLWKNNLYFSPAQWFTVTLITFHVNICGNSPIWFSPLGTSLIGMLFTSGGLSWNIWSIWIFREISAPNLYPGAWKTRNLNVWLHICQFSRGLKTSILCIKDNSSYLTHKSRQIVLEHMINNSNSIQFPQKCSKKVLNVDFVS